MDLPIASGFRVPFSITYASRTELIDESEVRGNFGISLDFDQLYALARSAAATQAR